MFDLDAILYDAIAHIKYDERVKNKILYIALKFFRYDRKQLTYDPSRGDDTIKTVT